MLETGSPRSLEGWAACSVKRHTVVTRARAWSWGKSSARGAWAVSPLQQTSVVKHSCCSYIYGAESWWHLRKRRPAAGRACCPCCSKARSTHVDLSAVFVVCAHRGQTITLRSWFFSSAICIWDIKLRSAGSVTGAFPISLARTPLFETVSISPGQHQTLPVVEKNLKYPACTS